LTFSWCTQLWIGSSMVCAVLHFKLNWNKTARQKNENSVTTCYKCACYYDEWYNMPVTLKIQMHAGQFISLKYGDQVFMSFWHCICTYFYSLHLLFSSIKKHIHFILIIHALCFDMGRTLVLHVESSGWCFVNACNCTLHAFHFPS